MKRLRAVLENVGAHRQRDAVDFQDLRRDRAALDHTTGGETNIRPVVFNKKPGGATRKPTEKEHIPRMTVRALPLSSATVVEAKELLGVLRNRNGTPCLRSGGPIDGPRGNFRPRVFVRSVPPFCSYLCCRQAEQDGDNQRSRERPDFSSPRLPGVWRLAAARHPGAHPPKSDEAGSEDGHARRIMPAFDCIRAVMRANPNQQKRSNEIAAKRQDSSRDDQPEASRRREVVEFAQEKRYHQGGLERTNASASFVDSDEAGADFNDVP